MIKETPRHEQNNELTVHLEQLLITIKSNGLAHVLAQPARQKFITALASKLPITTPGQPHLTAIRIAPTVPARYLEITHTYGRASVLEPDISFDAQVLDGIDTITDYEKYVDVVLTGADVDVEVIS